VCLAILAAATAYLMGWWIPQDTIRDLQNRGVLRQGITDVAPDSAQPIADRFSPGVRPTTDTPTRQRPDAPSTDVTIVEAPVTEPIERAPASSAARVELGAFPIYQLIQGDYRETTALNRVAVSVEIPATWRHNTDGQMFDAGGNKVGEIGLGVFAYMDGAACTSLPDSEMDGPPVERYAFDMLNVRGAYRRTVSFCGGGVDTYAGDCHVHSYCVQPPPNGLGLELTFLEPSPTTNTEQRAIYDRVVDSIRFRP